MRPVTEERPPGPAETGTGRSPVIKGAKNESLAVESIGMDGVLLGSFLLIVGVALAKERKAKSLYTCNNKNKKCKNCKKEKQ